eukprot:CAMPEP_0181290930 /NCGR_PEP_ID=MMETSP1101-20121128/1686_1 /TAXON_ID=46948 /ORGANISM="Rhodomonas abbreviata, Strain Caron Lab Isolate" /LENGTH=78 /DNA_ID=CAMNT_0023395267 /DNA_START=307 /DNA_END=543 /DNA_ORIENTATION=+
MNVSECPRKKTDENGAITSIRDAPNRIIVSMSAGFPRNDVSSNQRQYRTRKYMWNTKSKLGMPKKKKLENILHISNFS